MTTQNQLLTIIAKHKLTTEQVAKLCGVSSRTVFLWKNGGQLMQNKYLRLLELSLKEQATI